MGLHNSFLILPHLFYYELNLLSLFQSKLLFEELSAFKNF